MRDMEANRRRNQIIAQRAADKASQRAIRAMDTGPELWSEVKDALERELRSEIYSGHPDNAVRLVNALAALRELYLRGTQVELDLSDC
jgi:hypothetical protein